MTFSQGVDDVVLKFRIWPETLEVTVTDAVAGGAEVPVVIANGTLAADNSRSGVAFERTLSDIFRVPVSAGVDESVTSAVKPKSPAAAGVPDICPPARAMPEGKPPFFSVKV